MLEITDKAWEVLRRAMGVAGLDPARSAARARFVGGALRVGFVETASPGLVDVSTEHDELVLKPSGEGEDRA